jgi:hypothetical protein
LRNDRAALAVLASPFRSKLRLEAENAVLRHQLIVLRRMLHGRVRLTNHDRGFFIQPYRWFPAMPEVLTIIPPETLVRWHRAGFRCYWRWKSNSRRGRPPIEAKLRALIRQMSTENSLWGAPRIHGELLKLGFDRFVGAGKQRWRGDRMRRRLPPSARPSVMWQPFSRQALRRQPPLLRRPSRGCLLFPCRRSSQSSLIQKVLAASTRRTA